ncbi:homoserine kinase [Metschnikowia bicuspidata var. bicuspidata NRRL YB-4993]|uniref:Homoserine kinase n=1 Tax=Metschnikowia bicuspidata var. bicuspidata NRRL YB-4993 TaxID=869754 RepID=A0A1A0HE70_9ASCO|nr:homoserine kinase [Metschnikowia bicuspidata var. bicuspidata NRRL YB-4993]OBA22197.1 homoserine kinase [Metschnikowia bicuspidata var. bicuspidata NRRL YB-4993]
MRDFTIKVPASSANIGPGFDVLGIGLNLYLEIHVRVDSAIDTSVDTHNAKLAYEGDSAANVPLQSERNLVTQTALYVMRCNGIENFPPGTQIFVKNPIPLGRGLGSSGAAIVGGVMLGNEVGGFNFSKERLLDYCLLIERHPDNIAAAMLGGFVGSYLNELSSENQAAISVPLENILPKIHTPRASYENNPPPIAIGLYLKYQWNDKIRCVTIIPEFEVKTDDSRAVLPLSYEKKDIVFNLQRLAVLTTALTLDPPNHGMIYEAMKDKIHQPYRAQLIPGLDSVLKNVTAETTNGLCGICLSGAGPTILCLATDNFEGIANTVIDIFEQNNVKCTWKLLDLAFDGAVVDCLLEA